MTYCKDCYAAWEALPEPKDPLRQRPIVEKSGGRCHTHWKQALKARAKRAHEARVEKVYGLGRGQYEKLYEAQGGRCYICQVATGKTKRLAVDHDHKTGYVRGLLCSPCNRLLGHIRDSTLTAKRIVYYLNYPPAHTVLGKVKPQ